MTDPVQAQQIMLAAMAGAMAILFGALYALLYAFARIRNHRGYMTAAYLAYALFAVATMVLAWTLHLTGIWFSIVVIMLFGYLLAPRGIWHLCVGTHQAAEHSVPVDVEAVHEGENIHE